MFGYLQASFMRYARWRLMPVLDEQIHILYKLSDAFDDAGSDGKRPYGSVTSLVLNVKRLGRTGDQDVRRSCNTTKENAVIYRLQDKEKHNAVTSVDSHSMSPSMPRSSPTHTPTKRPSGECKVMMCEGAICSYRAMLFMTRHFRCGIWFLVDWNNGDPGLNILLSCYRSCPACGLWREGERPCQSSAHR